MYNYARKAFKGEVFEPRAAVMYATLVLKIAGQYGAENKRDEASIATQN